MQENNLPVTEVARFLQVMEAAGLKNHSSLYMDGKLHRFHVEGDKSGTKNGWYIIFWGDVKMMIFGCWRRGIKERWYAKDPHSMTPEEQEKWKQQMEAAQKAFEEEYQKIKRQARERAASIWQAAPPASDDHSYLTKKMVKNYGLRQSKERLVIPLQDTDGVLHSLQFIGVDGEKRFLSGGMKKGCCYIIGQPSEAIYIAEGYATAASIHEAVGHAVAVAFDTGNLQPVAKAFRTKFPDIKIVICADNDAQIPGNPGLTQARAAVAAVGGFLAYPREE
ncbi:MAG: toprim domain-containing protein [Alphaproteobacteria bacterium]|nr:toprim domain-containing protein [Alphaproteobacteria bacterium]